MLPENLSICAFDAYGTLFDIHSAVAAHREAVGPKADAVSALWRQKQIEYSWLRSLMGDHADFWQLTRDALDFALAAHGLDNRCLRDELLRSYEVLRAYPDAAPSLDALRRLGCKLAILSNGSPTMLGSAISSAGLDGKFDAVLSVEAVRIFKPHPSVYALVPAHFGVTPGEICFVSSNAWDVAGAARYGFPAVWINRLSHPPENLPGRARAVISSLAELPALVRPGS
ncbi:hypothetical protein AYO41_01135 [Verrucomicrobia bacterium SCGC AG-212-E04]|nr:hypothetical protein AYO41_01135 [Verrucomicrobia bacterium SCGC AG-212-E04]